MERSQKEYYLNEQMRAIQKELGEKDEFKNEMQEIEEKIKQKKLSAEAKEKVEKELKKLKMMSPMSAEATVVRNYIDWILSLPWSEYTDDKLDIDEARRFWKTITTGSTRSRKGSSSIWPFKRWWARSRGRSCAWWDLRASARPPWGVPSRVPRAGSSFAYRSAACVTKPRFAAIAAPISARCPGRSSSP